MFLFYQQQINMGCATPFHVEKQPEQVRHQIKLDRRIEKPKYYSQIVVDEPTRVQERALPQIQMKLQKQNKHIANPESIALKAANKTGNSKQEIKEQQNNKRDCQSEQPTKQNIENKLIRLDESKIQIIIEDTIRPSRASASVSVRRGGERLARLKKTKSIVHDGDDEVIDSFIKIQSKDNPFEHLGKLY